MIRRHTFWLNVVALVGLTLATRREVYQHAGPEVTRQFDRLRSSVLSNPRIDMSTYYEGLLYRGDGIKSDLMFRLDGYRGPIALTDDVFSGDTSKFWRRVDDLRLLEPSPNQQVNMFGVVHSFNKHGFRDNDYPEVPEPGTFRIALLGSSNLMGREQPDGRHFEPLLEERLQKSLGRKIEILNYGYDGYDPVAWLVLMDKGFVFERKPDLILLLEHTEHDFYRDHMESLLSQGKREAIGYPFLVESAEAFAGGERYDDVVTWVFGELLDRCKQHQVRCLTVGLPGVHDIRDPQLLEARLELIGKLRFPRVSLADIFVPYDLHDLQLHVWDPGHYNARAHALVADALHAALLKLDGVLSLGLKQPPGPLDAFYKSGELTYRVTE